MRRVTLLIVVTTVLALGACSGGSSDGAKSTTTSAGGDSASTTLPGASPTMTTTPPQPATSSTSTTRPPTEIPEGVKPLAPTVVTRVLAARDTTTAIVNACAADQKGAACQAGLNGGVVAAFADLAVLRKEIEKAAGGPLPSQLQVTVDEISSAETTRDEISKCDLAKAECQSKVSLLVDQIGTIADSSSAWQAVQ